MKKNTIIIAKNSKTLKAVIFRKGDEVWVNEWSIEGREQKHEWWGKIISVKNERAKIKDMSGGSYNGEIFERSLYSLEKKDK